jgi:putative redox protein
MTTSVIVQEAEDGVFAQAVRAGRHVLSADEPFAAGGTDIGPGPYEYLLAALGACTSMTLRMYARHKGWGVGRITVDLAHNRVYAEDCAECEKNDTKLDRIKRMIRIEGDLDDDKRRRLLEIADKCPVHRTLTSKIQIETSLD